MNLEDRLRNAVRAEADRIEPDETASLDTIRSQGRIARRRRRVVGGSILAVVVAGAVALAPRVRDDASQDVELIDQPDRTTTTNRPETTRPTETTQATAPSTTPPPPPPETTTSVTAETAPEGGSMPTTPVLWPGPDHAPLTDPVAAARSFAGEYVGFGDPALSAFRPGAAPDRGEVDVYWRGEDGQPMTRVASTLSLLQHEGAWFVVSAVSDDIVIQSPAPNSHVVGQVDVAGQGRGYEGTIHVVVRAAFTGPGQSLAQTTVTAGGGQDLEPFAATLAHGATPGSTGALIVSNDTGVTGGTVSFTAFPLAFG